MAANGISTLQPPSARAQAKLDLAQTKRQTAGTNGFRVLNILSSVEINPPRPVPLVQGRPWLP